MRKDVTLQRLFFFLTHTATESRFYFCSKICTQSLLIFKKDNYKDNH